MNIKKNYYNDLFLKMKNFTTIEVLKHAIDADSFFIFNLNNYRRGGQNI